MNPEIGSEHYRDLNPRRSLNLEKTEHKLQENNLLEKSRKRKRTSQETQTRREEQGLGNQHQRLDCEKRRNERFHYETQLLEAKHLVGLA